MQSPEPKKTIVIPSTTHFAKNTVAVTLNDFIGPGLDITAVRIPKLTDNLSCVALGATCAGFLRVTGDQLRDGVDLLESCLVKSATSLGVFPLSKCRKTSVALVFVFKDLPEMDRETYETYRVRRGEDGTLEVVKPGDTRYEEPYDLVKFQLSERYTTKAVLPEVEIDVAPEWSVVSTDENDATGAVLSDDGTASSVVSDDETTPAPHESIELPFWDVYLSHSFCVDGATIERLKAEGVRDRDGRSIEEALRPTVLLYESILLFYDDMLHPKKKQLSKIGCGDTLSFGFFG